MQAQMQAQAREAVAREAQLQAQAREAQLMAQTRDVIAYGRDVYALGVQHGQRQASACRIVPSQPIMCMHCGCSRIQPEQPPGTSSSPTHPITHFA